MGKRKEYRKIIKNYKEQKIVFQEEMKLDYSKLEETIAEAIKIEKERENENKRKHSKKRELLYKTLNIIFYMVLMIIVLSLLYSICMAFISGKIDDIEFHEADRQAFLDMGCGDLVLKYSIGQELLDTLAEIRSK